MRGEFTINGSNTYTTWGVYLAEESVEQFLAFPSLKDYITNDSALENGMQVLTTSAALPKAAARSLTLQVNMSASSESDFKTKYAAFKAVLLGGVLTITIPDHTSDVFHCLYVSCSQFSDYNGRVAKFALRLIEPNPTNRTASV